VDTVTIVRITPALCGLQHGALRNLAPGYIAPDRDQQLAGERRRGGWAWSRSGPERLAALPRTEPASEAAQRLWEETQTLLP